MPEAVLASIVFLIGIELVDQIGMRKILRWRVDEFVIALTTAAVVVVIGVEQGILLAMVLSVIDHLRRGYHPRDTDRGAERRGRASGSVPVAEPPPNEDIEPGLVVYRFAASLYYANANQFGEEVHAILERPAGSAEVALHRRCRHRGCRLLRRGDHHRSPRPDAGTRHAAGVRRRRRRRQGRTRSLRDLQNWSDRTRTSVAWWRPPRRSSPPRSKGRAMSKAVIKHLSVDERKAKGKGSREQTALSSHTDWEPAADRPDPVALLEEQNTTREQDLVPVRHGRMLVSPFTFYRGAAKIMAADLKDTPRAGLNVQLCGDAHLSNFGVFASPERTLLFDLNDFDETLPGPVRVRREAHGGELHDRGSQQRLHQGRDARRDARLGAGPTGRRWPSSRRCARWTSGTRICPRRSSWPRSRPCVASQKGKAKKEAAKGAERAPRRSRAKARTRDSLQALSKLAEHVDGNYRIVSQPPIVIPVRELGAVVRPVRRRGAARDPRAVPRLPSHAAGRPAPPARTLRGRSTWPARSSASAASARGRSSSCSRAATRRTRCSCRSRRPRASVLEDHLPKSRYKQPGERVVQGQRMMQAASDIYLGWTKGVRGQPLPLLAPAARHEGLGRSSRR